MLRLALTGMSLEPKPASGQEWRSWYLAPAMSLEGGAPATQAGSRHHTSVSVCMHVYAHVCVCMPAHVCACVASLWSWGDGT